MARPYQILFPLLSLFLCRVDLTDLLPLKIPVQVSEVLDGDTVVVTCGQRSWRVRLSRIDAPETDQSFLSGPGNAGLFSKDCLKNILKSSATHILEFEGHDIYKRVLGNVGNANIEMIRQGCAGIYPHATFRDRREKWSYLRLQQQAKARRLGIWAKGGVILPKAWRKSKKIKRRSVNR